MSRSCCAARSAAAPAAAAPSPSVAGVLLVRFPTVMARRIRPTLYRAAAGNPSTYPHNMGTPNNTAYSSWRPSPQGSSRSARSTLIPQTSRHANRDSVCEQRPGHSSDRRATIEPRVFRSISWREYVAACRHRSTCHTTTVPRVRSSGATAQAILMVKNTSASDQVGRRHLRLTTCCPSTVTAPPTWNTATNTSGQAIGNVARRDSFWRNDRRMARSPSLAASSAALAALDSEIFT